jgi:putative transposase
MRRKRFTEEQIIGILKEAEAGDKTTGLCRQHGISEQTFYRWKAKYGELEVNEARRLRRLEHENTRLKRLVADLTLDNQGVEGVGRKKGLTPVAQRIRVRAMQASFGFTERRACGLVGVDRSTCRYQGRRAEWLALRERLRALPGERRRFGYRRLHILLRREGYRVNLKRVYRLYREEGLAVRRRRRRRRVARGTPLAVPTKITERWSLDFLLDTSQDGRRVRLLAVVARTPMSIAPPSLHDTGTHMIMSDSFQGPRGKREVSFRRSSAKNSPWRVHRPWQPGPVGSPRSVALTETR